MRKHLRKAILCSATSAVFLTGVSTALAVDYIWIGPGADGSGDGNFTTAAHWNPSDNAGTGTGFYALHTFDTNTTHNNIIEWNASGQGTPAISNSIGKLFLREGDTLRTVGNTSQRIIHVGGELEIDGLVDLRNESVSTAGAPRHDLIYIGTAGMKIGPTGEIRVEIGNSSHTNRNSMISLTGNNATHTNQGTIMLKASDVGVGTGDNHGSARLQIAGTNSVFVNKGTVDVKDTARSRIQIENTTAKYVQEAGVTILGTTAGSGAQFRGGILDITGGTFKGTGTARGVSSSNQLKMTVSDSGKLAPGASVGTLTLNTNVDFLSFTGGEYEWELGALSTSNPGVDFDQILMNSGNLTITGGVLKPVFIGSATAPDLSEVFWQSDRSWVVINNTGAGTATGMLEVDNSAWAAHGSFSTMIDGNDLILTWSVIPEPASLGLLALGGLLMRRNRK